MCQSAHRISFSFLYHCNWQGDCVVVDKRKEDACTFRWTYPHLYIHIPLSRFTCLNTVKHMHTAFVKKEIKLIHTHLSYRKKLKMFSFIANT